MSHDIVWIEAAGQRLGLVPSLGGGVAEWTVAHAGAPQHLWRPWDRASEDRYRLASFAMLPWSNRISGGGFGHRGRFHPMAVNRLGEPYPIHGDGWLQPWKLSRRGSDAAELWLASHHHGGSPWNFEAIQRFELVDDGLVQSATVTHRGDAPMPYGLGLHPWFPRTPKTTITAQVSGVWLCGNDPIPTHHASVLPAGWDLAAGASARGTLIDNGFTGWNGAATIAWPERGLAVHATMAPLETPQGDVAPGYCLVYRPPAGDAFCFEPISQPIDAFHLEGRPGLVELRRDESLTMRVHWRVDTSPPFPH